MKKESIMILVLMISIGVVSAIPTTDISSSNRRDVSFNSDLMNRGESKRPVDLNPESQAITSSQLSNTNSNNCDPSWKGERGTPSCYDYSEKENIPAGYISGGGFDGTCPSLNPEFVECVSNYGKKPMNDGRDFENAKKYYSEAWIKRQPIDKEFQWWKATFNWLTQNRKSRILIED